MKDKHLAFGSMWVCVAMVFVAMVFGFTSCQEKYEPMDAIQQLADKNIPNTYSWISVDSSAMQTEIREYVLKADGTGVYKVVKSGANMATDQTSTDLTWRRGDFVDNNVWVEVFVEFPAASGLAPQTLKWGSATMIVDGKFFSRGNYSTNTAAIYSNFSNTTWIKADTTFFSRVDTVYNTYLAWNQVKGDAAYLTDEEIATQRAYFAQQWVKDTIAWYNETYKKNVPDSIRVTTAKKSGKTFCVFYSSTEMHEVIPVDVHLAPSKIDCSLFHFDRTAANVNTGSYSYHYFEQDSTHYIDPADPKANAYDSTYTFTANSWCVSLPTSTGNFTLVATGTLVEKVWRTTNGKKETIADKVTNDYVMSFPLSGFFAGEEITYAGKKHIFVK